MVSIKRTGDSDPSEEDLRRLTRAKVTKSKAQSS